MRRNALPDWVISLLCLCMVALSPSSSSGQPRRHKDFTLGTFDSSGKLQNAATEAQEKIYLGSFAGYFLKDQDINLGLSVGRPSRSSIQWTLDIAPHHIGPGFTWSPRTGKYRYLSVIGAGIGANITYDTEKKALEAGVKVTLVRWN